MHFSYYFPVLVPIAAHCLSSAQTIRKPSPPTHTLCWFTKEEITFHGYSWSRNGSEDGKIVLVVSLTFQAFSHFTYLTLKHVQCVLYQTAISLYILELPPDLVSVHMPIWWMLPSDGGFWRYRCQYIWNTDCLALWSNQIMNITNMECLTWDETHCEQGIVDFWMSYFRVLNYH